MRGIIKSLTALAIVGVLTAGAEAKNLGSGEMATYVPIPTYGLMKGELEKSGKYCWWDIDVSAKQLGGKEIKLGEIKIKSPYLCRYDKDLQAYYNQMNSAYYGWNFSFLKKPDLSLYLKNEAGYLNGVIQKAYDTLKGNVGANTMVFTLHYSAPNGAEWYYTGSVVSGMVISYGWQKKPTGNAIAFYYNSTAGKISDQAPKPTDRPDSFPVYDFTGSSKVEQIGNELNKNVRGGYKEEIYTNNTLVSKKYVDSKHKYDTFAETYTDTTCKGGSVTYSAASLGKGIAAFEKEVVIPELQAQNKDEGIVTFYYSPTVVDVNDRVTLRKLDAICPAGYSFSCKEDQCVKYVPIKKDGAVVGYEKKTTSARVIFTVNHAVTAKLTRTVRTDIVTADGKVTTIYNQDFPLPDLKYNVKLTKGMGTSYRKALNTVKNKSLSDYDCTWGQLEPYTGNTPLTGTCFVDSYKEPEPPPLPPPPSRPQPSQIQAGIVPVKPTSGGGGSTTTNSEKKYEVIGVSIVPELLTLSMYGSWGVSPVAFYKNGKEVLGLKYMEEWDSPKHKRLIEMTNKILSENNINIQDLLYHLRPCPKGEVFWYVNGKYFCDSPKKFWSPNYIELGVGIVDPQDFLGAFAGMIFLKPVSTTSKATSLFGSADYIYAYPLDECSTFVQLEPTINYIKVDRTIYESHGIYDTSVTKVGTYSGTIPGNNVLQWQSKACHTLWSGSETKNIAIGNPATGKTTTISETEFKRLFPTVKFLKVIEKSTWTGGNAPSPIIILK